MKRLSLLLALLFAVPAWATDPTVTLSPTLVDSGSGTVVRFTVHPNDADPTHDYFYEVIVTAPDQANGTIDSATALPTGGQTVAPHDCSPPANRTCAVVYLQQTTPSTATFDLGDFGLTGIVADQVYWYDFSWCDVATSQCDDTLNQTTIKVRHLKADADGDGVVGQPDYTIYSQEFGHSCPTCCANANNDGAVGVPDYLILAQEFGHHGGTTACIQGGSHCCGGQ